MKPLYMPHSSAICPTLQTLAPIQSSTSISQSLFGLPLLISPSTVPLAFDFFFLVKQIDYCFLIKFSSVPDAPQNSSAGFFLFSDRAFNIPSRIYRQCKGSFYIAQYPVRWTAQSALHFLPSLADMFIPTPTRLLREAF